MRCPNCGQENPACARFCFSCGHPFDEAPAREERKVVTVLFADLVGFTSRAEGMDPEDVRALLAPYHERLRSELERFGGTVEKFIGDAVMALFGAPVAHEDDAERAVRAAVAIPVWTAIAPRSELGVDVEQSGRTPLIGRDQELALLLGTAQRVREDREPQLVTLVGVPGIGKSRLTFELFGALSDDETLRWRQGRCLPYGDGVAFSAVGEIVKSHAEIFESDDAERAEQKLIRAIEAAVAETSEATWIARHLRSLIGVGTEESASGHDAQADAFAAWRRFLEALAEQGPLVVVFEDLHWADDELLGFVDLLVDWASDVPLLVVCTARPELLERRPDWGGGKANATTLP